MSEGMVRKWIRQFNDRCSSVHDETRNGNHFVVIDSLVEKMKEKIHENKWFTIWLLCDEFSQRAVQQLLSSLAASFFKEGIDNLVSRYARQMSEQWLRGHRVMNMKRYTNAELVDIHFIYGLANGNGCAAVRLYGERYPTRWQLTHQTFAIGASEPGGAWIFQRHD
ncbi:HTH_48 domain-containing protein [Trichonephila clavipes]|nr:HTH_48 domain-containing protein [Trichonephila clavipes]